MNRAYPYEAIVIEPGDLVLIGGLANHDSDFDAVEELRKELPHAKVFAFQGHIDVHLAHGEQPDNKQAASG